MMNDSDKEDWREARPWVVGVAAVLIQAANLDRPISACFDAAEQLADEFERRNEIK